MELTFEKKNSQEQQVRNGPERSILVSVFLVLSRIVVNLCKIGAGLISTSPSSSENVYFEQGVLVLALIKIKLCCSYIFHFGDNYFGNTSSVSGYSQLSSFFIGFDCFRSKQYQ